MKHALALAVSALLLASCGTAAKQDDVAARGAKAYEHLIGLEEIGARPSSSPAEAQAADWIAGKLSDWGYDVTRQPFSYTKETDKGHHEEAGVVTLNSQNIEVTIPGRDDRTIVVGAHYDSKGEGSQGATDNGAGVSALLALAEALRGQSLPHTVKVVFFGAEENGLNGSKAYAAALKPADAARIGAMVNYDTIAGGDVLYVHSALTDPAEYECADPARYSSSPQVRDRLLALSREGGMEPYQMHPDFPGYPSGQTGGWSDHAGFACLGIPVAQVEATNFAINGEDGYDGYSQTVNPAMWDCYDANAKGACDREAETKWGKIWHTPFDRLGELEQAFPGRVREQVGSGVELLVRYVRDPRL